MSEQDARRAIDAVWRIESARLIAGLARMTGDVGDRRGPGPGRARHRARAVAALRRPRQPRRLADDDGEEPRNRPAAARRDGGAQAGRAGPGSRAAGTAGRAGPRRGCRRRDRRRPAQPDLHRLPPGALDRGAGGADAAPGRLAEHGGDRPRLPRQGVDGGAADRPRQADAGRGAGADRGAGRGRARAAAGLGAGGDLRDLQRGLRGERRRGLDPGRPLRGGDAAGTDPRRAGADASRKCWDWLR